MSIKKKINKEPVKQTCKNCVHALINEREQTCTNEKSVNYRLEIEPNFSCNKFDKKLRL